MKNSFLFCFFLVCAATTVAQDQDPYFDWLWNLRQQVWVRGNGDAWTFNSEELSANDYQVEFELHKDSLTIFEKDESSEEYGTKYILSHFRVNKLTNEDFVIHPLDLRAIKFLDTDAMYTRNRSARNTMYKTYLSELKAAGKDEVKRKAILSKYKKQYNLDVDQVSFKSKSYFFEPVKIDSVDVSLTWKVNINESTNRIEYNDLRWISANSSYLFGYRFENQKIDTKTLTFIPPVVMKDDEFSGKKKKTPQDSLIHILNEAPAGWYTGIFAPEGIELLNKSLYTYGVNKPHQPGDKAGCKYAVRIYHEGKITDYYRNDWEEEPYLLTDFFVFLDNWTSYVRTFEKVQDKTIIFPIAVKK